MSETRTISCDEAIIEGTEILIQCSGEWIAEIYNKVSGKTAIYENDSLITVIEEE